MSINLNGHIEDIKDDLEEGEQDQPQIVQFWT